MTISSRFSMGCSSHKGNFIHHVLRIPGGIADELLECLGICFWNHILHAFHILTIPGLDEALQVLARAKMRRNGRLENALQNGPRIP